MSLPRRWRQGCRLPSGSFRWRWLCLSVPGSRTSGALLHSFEELFCTHVPIDLVGFGDEEAGQGLFVVSQFLLECGVVHQSGYFGGVYHELFAYAACQPVQCACAADGEIRRFLISAVQTAEYVIYVSPGRWCSVRCVYFRNISCIGPSSGSR